MKGMLVASIIENDLCFIVQKLSRRLSRRINRTLKDLELTGEVAIMRDVTHAPVRPPYNALHIELGLDRSTISANIKPLLQRGRMQIRSTVAPRGFD
ncbi:hypothetical protein A6U97_26655 [Agrobacterium tumefaciens]|nr:hypothetical protein A6U97_26655 [Agrobacterium tumefaciens]